jgi:hypothetical protein
MVFLRCNGDGVNLHGRANAYGPVRECARRTSMGLCGLHRSLGVGELWAGPQKAKINKSSGVAKAPRRGKDGSRYLDGFVAAADKPTGYLG